MPNATIKNFAPKYAERNEMDDSTAISKLEELWDRAKSIAEKKFDTEEGEQFWSYVMGIWKRMVNFDGKSEASSTPLKMACIKIDLSQ